MAYTLITEIEINASAEKVWNTLLDHANYLNWNPFLKMLEGDYKLGGQIKIQITPPGSNGMVFKPMITKLVPNQKLQWLGSLGFKGIFDGRHQFEIQEIAPNTIRFIHSESFTGILVPLMKKSLDNGTKKGFESMNKALKTKCEE